MSLLQGCARGLGCCAVWKPAGRLYKQVLLLVHTTPWVPRYSIATFSCRSTSFSCPKGLTTIPFLAPGEMQHGQKILPCFFSSGWAPGGGRQDGRNTCGVRPVPCLSCSGAAPIPCCVVLCSLAPHTLWLRWCKYCSLRRSPVVGQGRKSHYWWTRVCCAFSRR